MSPLDFIQSWLKDIRRVSGVDGADALMMALIENRLKVMDALELPKPKFMLGEIVDVTDDIAGRIERIEFRRGAVLPYYQVSWWDSGERAFEWFIEPDLSLDPKPEIAPGIRAGAISGSRPTAPPPPKPKR
ncbi:MAG: hypothetical protein AAGI09_02870 [Pseudomonadota bacterium]